jgi:hypothetical protein
VSLHPVIKNMKKGIFKHDQLQLKNSKISFSKLNDNIKEENLKTNIIQLNNGDMFEI